MTPVRGQGGCNAIAATSTVGYIILRELGKETSRGIRGVVMSAVCKLGAL